MDCGVEGLLLLLLLSTIILGYINWGNKQHSYGGVNYFRETNLQLQTDLFCLSQTSNLC